MEFKPDPAFPFAIEERVLHPIREPFSLPSFYQMIFLKKGKIYCQPAGTVLREGQLIVLPPAAQKGAVIAGDVKVIRAAFNEIFIEHLSVNFNMPVLGVDFPFLVSSGEAVIYPLNTVYAEAIHTLLTSMIGEYADSGSPAARLMIQTQFIQILITLGRLNRPAEKQSEKRDPISEIINTIREHYSDEFQFQNIVDMSGWNASYFCKVFRSRTGMSLFEYINTVRIQKSCIMLKKTDLNIIDIAFDVGYQNLSFFNRSFRKITGMSPSEYRRNIRK